MNKVYKIKEKSGLPTIFVELVESGQVVGEYFISLYEGLEEVPTEKLQEYSDVLAQKFDNLINEIKESGLNKDSFTTKVSIVTELTERKTICDSLIERRDIIE